MSVNRENNYFYNASGYADPTAAEAIRRTLRSTKMTNDPKAYEIWNKDGQLVLVLSSVGRIVTYTQLNYESTEFTNLVLGNLYANTNMIAHSWSDRLDEYVRALTDAERGDVMHLLADQYDLKPETIEVVKEVEVIKEVPTPAATGEDVARLQIQIELLQQMYKDLLDRIVSR